VYLNFYFFDVGRHFHILWDFDAIAQGNIDDNFRFLALRYILERASGFLIRFIVFSSDWGYRDDLNVGRTPLTLTMVVRTCFTLTIFRLRIGYICGSKAVIVNIVRMHVSIE
jgi:hypothetical protein